MAGVGKDLLTVCVELSKLIMPHLLLVFSIEWLEKKQGEANPPGTCRLVNMPNDIIVNILMRLPSKSLCCLRCVSKTCLDMVDSPIFTTLHRERLLKLSTSDYAAAAAPEVPQIVYLQIYFDRIQWWPFEHNDKCRLTLKKNPLCVSKMYMMDTVEFVFCNLFFLRRGMQDFLELITPNSYYLVDPLRGEILNIPDCPANNKYLVDWLGMGFDDTTNTYKIVCVLESPEKTLATAHIYVLGTHDSSSWREIQSVPPSNLSKKNVCAYGDMHWLVKKGRHVNVADGGSRIISFDFKKEEFTWTPHPTLEGLHEDCNLLNMKGSMAMVDANSSGDYIHIWVVKSYLKKEWSLNYKINTQTLAGYPVRGIRYYKCYEWEHGIAFHVNLMCYHLDLRCNSIKAVNGGFRNVYSFTESLISLRKL